MNVVAPDASFMQQQLTDLGLLNAHVHAFEQLGSTSAWLRQHAAELLGGAAAHGLLHDGVHVCITDWQTAGVGRRGTSWQTQPGNVTMSLLTQTDKPADALMGLSLVTGVAVAECLSDTFNIKPQLKWPNDIVSNGLKLGGLLTELSKTPVASGGGHATQLYTGIGVNIIHDESVVALGIGATSIEALGVTLSRAERDSLAASLVAHVLSEHQRFYQSGWAAFASRWAALDWLHNQPVLIHRKDATEQGTARGVDETGALLVERAGEITPVFSADVSIRRSAT